ncbi:MAG: hypothetical protein ACOC9N_01670, partial [Gemmatimonadota bacterium]
MLIRRPDDIPSSEITPEGVYLDRRRFVNEAARFALAAGVAPGLLVGCDAGGEQGGEVRAATTDGADDKTAAGRIALGPAAATQERDWSK